MKQSMPTFHSAPPGSALRMPAVAVLCLVTALLTAAVTYTVMKDGNAQSTMAALRVPISQLQSLVVAEGGDAGQQSGDAPVPTAGATESSSSSQQQEQQRQPSGARFLDAYPTLNSTAVMTLQPSVRGWTTKQGPSHRPDWLKSQEDARLSSFLDWRVQRGTRASLDKAYTCDKADHPPLAYPGCHVFINHK
jgi:hypothetical protein